MAQGVAWGARALGVPCTVVMPDSAPRTKVDAVERLGATHRVMCRTTNGGRRSPITGAPACAGTFIHPVADRAVMAGNGTIGLEIVEDLPDVDAVLVPFGGGGLDLGHRDGDSRARAERGDVTAARSRRRRRSPPRSPRGAPVVVERTPSFVDGIGGRGVLPEMWPIVSRAGRRRAGRAARRGGARGATARRARARRRRGRRRDAGRRARSAGRGARGEDRVRRLGRQHRF